MAIDDPNIVDIVSVDPAGNVVLTVSDHLDWTDTAQHQLMLQTKLNRYLAFVESGEIIESHPDAKGRPVVFRVVALFEPDSEGVAFLQRVRKGRAQAGVSSPPETGRSDSIPSISALSQRERSFSSSAHAAASSRKAA
jgi:CRP-like cAMP-binding protein